MLDISKISNEQKSVLLVKAMGKYEVVNILAVVDALVDGDRKHYWKNDGVIEQIPNFYDLTKMHLAWRLHILALNNPAIRGRYFRWCGLLSLSFISILISGLQPSLPFSSSLK